MQRLAFLVSVGFVLLATYCRGQDFDLGDALDDGPTKKPTTRPKKPASDGDLDLGDALGGDIDQPTRPQRPGGHGNSGGGFDDSELIEGTLSPEKPGGGQDSDTGEKHEGGMLAGIISSVTVAVIGAVSSFIAYQKKKLCFKQSDQENVNMENQQGAQAGPPVQRTLLQKS